MKFNAQRDVPSLNLFFKNDTSSALYSRPLTHAVKVGDDLVEDPKTFDASVVDALLGVEVGKVWYGGEHHTNLIIRLAVQLLRVGFGQFTGF